jgi:hypothetical protein
VSTPPDSDARRGVFIGVSMATSTSFVTCAAGKWVQICADNALRKSLIIQVPSGSAVLGYQTNVPTIGTFLGSVPAGILVSPYAEKGASELRLSLAVDGDLVTRAWFAWVVQGTYDTPLPQFDVPINIWATSPVPAYATPRIVTVCNLFTITNVNQGKTAVTTGQILSLPPLTDIRVACNSGAGKADVIEVPAGSGRTYAVNQVDDLNKNLPSEFRWASVGQNLNGFTFSDVGLLPWPQPLN